MTTPFVNPKDQEHFIRQGYVTFPLLGQNELKEIRKIYDQLNTNNRLNQSQFYGVSYSLGTVSAQESSEAMNKVRSIIALPLSRHFSDFELMGCVFITKPAHTLTTFVYHQDWCYTDEKNHAFATCWVPLVDTSTENGCMSLVAGSHRFYETYRSDTLDSARISFGKIPVEIRTDIPQLAGGCLAFHQGVFHGSHPNISAESRPVLAFVVKHRDSPVMHYVKEADAIAAYRLSVDAFNQMLNQIPKSSLPDTAFKTSSIQYSPKLPTAESLVASYRGIQPKHRLLKDELNHLRFQRDGYLLLKGVLSVSAVEQLREMYAAHFKTRPGMYVTHHDETDASKNQSYSTQIFKLIANFLQQHFTNYRSLIAHFAAKSPGASGQFDLHQDWSIVEEELYGVMHCWIPLQNVSEQNGTLAILPGSHLCFFNYRSGTCPIRFFSLEAFQKNALNIKAEIGDVVLYHPALFHGSGLNRSEAERLAVVAAVTHQDAKTVYFHKDENKVMMYALTEQDLHGRLDHLAKGGLPSGNLVCEVQPRSLDISNDVAIAQLNEIIT